MASKAPESQPTAPTDISVDIRLQGRHGKLTKHEETLVTAAVQHFAKTNMPLTKLGLRQIGAHVLKKSRHLQLCCSTQTPSKTWMYNFIKRIPTLSIRSVRAIQSQRIQAVTRRNVVEYIAKMQAAMDRFNMHDTRRIFNTDESGVSFRTMAGKSLIKASPRGTSSMLLAL